MHVCVCGDTCAMAHAWRTEDNSKNQFSPFTVWVPEISEGHNSKYLCLLNQFTVPRT